MRPRWCGMVLGFCAPAALCAKGSGPSATLDSGTIVGTTTVVPSSTVTVNKFLGIPFASPPERFGAPVPAKKWKGSLDATEIKPACIQAFICKDKVSYPRRRRNHVLLTTRTTDPKDFHDFIKSLADNPPLPESEDCLYLSVYAPSSPPPPGGRSILFFINGGNFQFGSGNVMDGSRFAAYEDVVFVSANYRTNGSWNALIVGR